MKKQNDSEPKKTLDVKLVAYSAAVGAALTVTPSAHAAITYYYGSPPWTGSLVSFNLAGDVLTNGGHVADEQFYFHNEGSKNQAHSLGIQGWRGGTTSKVPGGNAAVFASWRATNSKGGGTNLVVPLRPGDVIGPRAHNPLASAGLLFRAGGGGGKDPGNLGLWSPGSRGFVGLRFDGPGTDVYYGWADILTSSTDVALLAYAYEDSGGPIMAGELFHSLPPAVPVPSTLLLLASGAAGLAALRHRKHRSGDGELASGEGSPPSKA